MPDYRCRLCLVLVLCGGTVRSAVAQAPTKPLHVTGESAGTAQRLAAADKMAAQGQWTDAINEYQGILDQGGDKLVPVSADHDVQARLLCQLRLAALPPAVLSRYRDRVDASAAKLLAEGRSKRDARLLRRVVDESFPSRSTDQALDLLGDLAFERGDFDLAIHWWRLIVRPASDQGPARGAPSLELLFPDPHVDVARIRAKQLLAELYRGNRAGIVDELRAYRKLHGAATGDFAGRVGKFADTLQALADRPGPLFPAATQWRTFGGTAARTLDLPRIPTRIAHALSPRKPLWRRTLVEGGNARAQMMDQDSPKAAQEVARRLGIEPLVIGKQVLVADARSVTAYDLLTGKPDVWFELPKDDSAPPLGLTAPLDLRYTLSAADGFVFARLGVAAIGPKGDGESNTSSLACLKVVPDTNGSHLQWLKKADAGQVFEGTPVVGDNKLYVAVSQFTATTETTFIACYLATTGRPVWQKAVEICKREGKLPAERYHHHLLTLAGPNVVYCSHSGAVLALDAASGRHAWAFRYPSRGEKLTGDESSPRDLCPCVYADGLVLAAPADYDHILALDAITGDLIWRSTPLEVVQLIGVSGGRLFFTTPKDIRALDLVTGVTPRGWIQPDDGSSLPPFGRGFLTADLVFWPTENGLRVLRQKDATPAEEWYAFIEEQGPAARLGNLSFAHDCLIVAGADDLTVYAPESVRLEADRTEANAYPASAAARYRLALAEMAAGHDAAAWDDLMRAGQRARPQDQWHGAPLAEAVRASRHELLLTNAAEAARQRRFDGATKWLTRAAAPEFTVAQRLAAIAQLAKVSKATGKPEDALAAWRSVRADRQFYDAEPIIAAALAELTTGKTRNVQERPQPHGSSLPHVAGPLTATWKEALKLDESLLPAHQARSSRSGISFFTVRQHTVTCRSADTGQARWTRALPGPPLWLGIDDNHVLVSDGSGVRTFRLTDGKPSWSFLPSLWSAVGRLGNSMPSTWAISACQLTAGRLFCLLGERILCAVATETGGLLWYRAAPGAAALPLFPGGRFNPYYHASEATVVVQAALGKLLVLDSATGRCLHELALGRIFWPRRPLPLHNGRLCLVLDSQHMALLDPAAGTTIWWQETHIPSITALSPQPIGGAGTLLAIIDGCELSRIDPNTGQILWTELTGPDPLTSNQVVLDQQAVYFIRGHKLVALNLTDGQRLWEVPFPKTTSAWRIIRAGGSLLVVPRHAQQEMNGPWLTSSYLAAFPLELAWRDVPLLLCRTGSDPGGFRFDIPAHGPDVTVQAVTDGLVVGTRGHVRAFQVRNSSTH
jgi:outer membrane protein assembly factor BamB/tetratricopeptide (TPR) repeat protein